jgi:hypothetical protein
VKGSTGRLGSGARETFSSRDPILGFRWVVAHRGWPSTAAHTGRVGALVRGRWSGGG